MILQGWFEKGMTFEQYRSSMKVNREELERVYAQLKFLDEDLEFLKNLRERKWIGVVLTADWCGDAALCVPILQRMAEEANIELRFLDRDENLELMDQYLTNGTSRSIPMFVFLNRDGEEAKVWGPRSPEVQAMVTSLRAALPSPDAPDFSEKQQEMFRHFKEQITTDVTIWRTVIESVKSRLN